MAKKHRLHRSELAVTGSNPRMIEKAPQAGADCVFLDLEDAVAPDDKAQARKNVIEALNELDWSNTSVSIRINGLDTHYCYHDIIDVVEQAGDKLDSILVPKVGKPSELEFVALLLSQIEAAKGLKPTSLTALIGRTDRSSCSMMRRARAMTPPESAVSQRRRRPLASKRSAAATVPSASDGSPIITEELRRMNSALQMSRTTAASAAQRGWWVAGDRRGAGRRGASPICYQPACRAEQMLPRSFPGTSAWSKTRQPHKRSIPSHR